MERGTRILVVDDEPMMREVMSEAMEMEGHVVEVVAGGAAALEAIAARRPDLVLLDLNMPGVTGWQVIDRLKDLPSPPPVIAISGMGTQEPPELQAVRKYVYGYLPKPFTNEQLVKIASRALKAALDAQAPPRVPQTLSEHRAEPRRNLLLSATLLSAAEGTPAAAVRQILNLSPGGAQLDLEAALQAGMPLTLAFEIPGGQGPFRVAGRIQWTKDGKVGLSFVDMPASDRRRLEELLATS